MGDAAVLIVINIVPMSNSNGVKRHVTCRINEGTLDTKHPPGKVTYYELNDADGLICRVPMVEYYHKKQIVSGETGSHIAFWFPHRGWIPEIGQKYSCKLYQPKTSVH